MLLKQYTDHQNSTSILHSTRIAVCVYTTNAAQTIRAVEIAKATQKQTPSTDELVIRFFAYRGYLPGGPKRTIDYEHLIHDAGFDVEYFGSLDPNPSDIDGNEENEKSRYAAAVLDDDMWMATLQAERNHEGIFPPPYYNDRATPYLQAIMNTLKDFQPDEIVYGLFPEVAVASAIQGWKTVSFAALPMDIFRYWMQKRYRDEKLIVSKNPWEVIQNAALECGLKLPDDACNINAEFMKAIRPTQTVVCDFECYYKNQNLSSDVTVVGPIISSDDATYEPKDVREIESFMLEPPYSSANGNIEAPIKVLLTMGSTGESTIFFEGLKALRFAKPGTFRSVVIIPSTVLHQSNEDTDAIIQSANSSNEILIVKKFVPIIPIMQFIDVVLSHGGQQTIQCALSGGVPVVGRPAHGEQLYNLENVERCQVGVCVASEDWNEENIRKVLLQVGGGDGPMSTLYKEAAGRMQVEFLEGRSGVERAGSIIWEMIDTQN